MSSAPPTTAPHPEARDAPRGGTRSGDALLAVLAAIAVLHFLRPAVFDQPAVQAWSTVFVAVCLQALPFLVLGVLLSAAISTFVPASFFAHVLPGRPAAAVPVAGLAGAVLPGCECASVPVAGGLIRRGVAPAAALASCSPPRPSTRSCSWPPPWRSRASRRWSSPASSPPRSWRW